MYIYIYNCKKIFFFYEAAHLHAFVGSHWASPPPQTRRYPTVAPGLVKLDHFPRGVNIWVFPKNRGLEDYFPFFSWVICRFHVYLPLSKWMFPKNSGFYP